MVNLIFFKPAGVVFFVSLLSAFALFAPPSFAYDKPTPTEPPSSPMAVEEIPESQEGSFWKDRFRFSSIVWQKTAFRIGTPKNFSMIKQFAKVDFKFLFNDTIQMKIGGRAWYDAVYDLTDQFPPDVNENMRKEIALRDAYIDIFVPKLHIRLGHQQIVWGEALAQFFSDVVNPRDLRYFILPPFEYIRLPIWALDIRYFFAENATLELVASPDQTVDKLAPPGADFSFFPLPGEGFFVQPGPPPGFTLELLPDNRPATNFKDWNGGARISLLIKGWDFSWLYYTRLDAQPALFKTASIDIVTAERKILLEPEHHRVHNLGFTFSKGVKSSIVRGEIVFILDRFYNAQNVVLNQGVVQKPALRYVLGFDTTLGGRVDMTTEFQQQIIFGDVSDVADPTIDSFLVLRFETGFFEERLVPELAFVLGFRAGDTLIRPRINYNVSNAITLAWGADIFTGPTDSLYGQFKDSSRIYMQTIWRY